ncbi:MAG: tyrosine-type recombinase/integrase [Terracidiphilus sp.]
MDQDLPWPLWKLRDDLHLPAGIFSMVRAGISLPALMQLMGHADIETTMHYVKVSPQDVYLQYARAAAQCIHPQPRIC